MSVVPRMLSSASGQGRAHTAALLAWSIPLLALAYLLALSQDSALARFWFALEGGHWSLKDSLLLEHILHRGGRLLSLSAWIALLAAVLGGLRRHPAPDWHPAAVRLLVATALGAAVVAALKSTTHMDCPWDLASFGGTRPFIALWQARPPGLGTPGCFPAAHASSGYAWVALYFFFARVRPAWRWRGLAAGVSAGAVFGLAQQLRGAHFLSHDVASLAVCWFTACAVDMARPGAGKPV